MPRSTNELGRADRASWRDRGPGSREAEPWETKRAEAGRSRWRPKSAFGRTGSAAALHEYRQEIQDGAQPRSYKKTALSTSSNFSWTEMTPAFRETA